MGERDTVNGGTGSQQQTEAARGTPALVGGATSGTPEPAPKGYWDLVRQQFLKNRLATASLMMIFALLLLAAWAPVLANGKPFVWRQGGESSYPLFQYLVAPTDGPSVDYFFNYLVFASLTVPLALLAGWLASKRALSLPRARRYYRWCAVLGLFVAVLPFIGSNGLPRKWHNDSTDYPRLAATLDKASGESAVFAPLAQDPITPTRACLQAPSREHWLGTDKIGRDVTARMLHGARISLSVGFVSVLIAMLLGIFFGALAGFYRGWVDIAISRFIEVVICFPSFFLILTIVAFIEPENRSIFHIMLVIGATGWPGIARLVRGEFLKLAKQDFVQSARALGCSNARLMFRHILPNAMGPVLVSAAFGVAGAILTEAGLSYLGFGAPPPLPTWGEMISQGKEYLEEAWWLIVFPGFSIFVSVTIYNVAGEGLRDAMDPKMRQ